MVRESKVIKILNKGWFVANFKLSYETVDNKSITQQTSIIVGQRHTFNITEEINFSVDKPIRLVGEAMAGITIMNITVESSPACFHVWGSTIFPSWSSMPCW